MFQKHLNIFRSAGIDDFGDEVAPIFLLKNKLVWKDLPSARLLIMIADVQKPPSLDIINF